MTIHYLDGGPFKAEQRGNYGYYCYVVAYDDDIKAFWCGYSGQNRLFIASAEELRPPPPIPAAARKPQVGEVWMTHAGPRLIVSFDGHGHARTLDEYGHTGRWSDGTLPRPATPAEAEPFRPILDGLKRSLGEA